MGLIQRGYRVADRVRRVYWFVFRPKTTGVKCLVEHDGKWLLIRNTYTDGAWTLPGGGVHRGEDHERAAIREVLEEVGIELGSVRSIGSYFNGREYKKDTVHCYRAIVDSSDFRIDSKEIAEAAWFSPTDLPAFRGWGLDEVLKLLNGVERS